MSFTSVSAEMILNIAVCITTLTVACITIGHGDLALGLLLLLGQLQTIVGHDNAHKTCHEATHLVAHKNV